MDLPHYGICCSGNDCAGVDNFTVLSLPMAPETSQGKVTAIDRTNKIGLLVRINLLPFVKATCGNDTTPLFEWTSKGRFVSIPSDLALIKGNLDFVSF